VYRPLARALVATSPVPLAGRLVLDVGSGTGAVAEAADTAGAHVVTTDRTHEMIAFPAGRWPAVAADVAALPFVDAAFDAVLAGFVLNHLAPAAALRESVRVVRAGGVVLASTWASEARDPVKSAIDDVLDRWGWVPPEWYVTMRAHLEPVAGDPARLASAATEAGLIDVTTTAGPVDVGVRDPRTVIEYRLSMPQVAPWVATLGEPARSELTREALAAAAGRVEPDGWRPAVVLLAGRVATQPNRRANRSSAPA